MFSPQGPSLRELAVQALSSVEDGYDLLAPKFDYTPFRTPDGVLGAAASALVPFGPFGRGLDVCCGTGAGIRVLRCLCQQTVVGVDFSTGMLAQARRAHLAARWVRADARALPFTGAFDLAVSFGALGHFLPAERPALFAGVYRALRPGGVFAFPIGAPQPVTSGQYWALLGFDLAMRVRNAVWRPPFVMYYRTCSPHAVRDDLTAAGFTVTTVPLTALGTREDGSPRCLLVLARRASALSHRRGRAPGALRTPLPLTVAGDRTHDDGDYHVTGGDPMILINIKMQIRPEKMDQWMALADSYAKDVNSEEGCLFFQFARSLTDEAEFVCIEGFKDADAGAAHVRQPYVRNFFDTAPDLVATQPQIIYIDTPHDGFGPMGEIQPR